MDGIFVAGLEHRTVLYDLFRIIREDAVALRQLYPLTFSDYELELALHCSNRDQSYVYLYDGKAIGYGMLCYEDANCPTLAVAVHPDYRNAKVGSAIMLEMMWAARDQGAHMVVLFVYSWNPARRLYERLGFRFTSRASHVDGLIGTCVL